MRHIWRRAARCMVKDKKAAAAAAAVCVEGRTACLWMQGSTLCGGGSLVLDGRRASHVLLRAGCAACAEQV